MSGTTLGTLVTYNPWWITPSMLLEDVAVRFAEMNIHHVVVVDDNRRAIGIVSETDILRARQTRRLAAVGAGANDTHDLPLLFARDVMTRSVVSIAPTATFREALELLLSRHIHALAVVEAERLTGIITSRDFLREFSYGELPATREPISTILTAKPPEPAALDSTLDEALLMMHEMGVSCLAVAQGDCPVGVVSQRDIVREKCQLEEQADYNQEMWLPPTLTRVVRNSPAIRSGQRLCEAAAAMVEHQLPAVTIVNQSNRMLGLVTEDDILKVLYDSQA